jgi:hypothetical protein
LAQAKAGPFVLASNTKRGGDHKRQDAALLNTLAVSDVGVPAELSRHWDSSPNKWPLTLPAHQFGAAWPSLRGPTGVSKRARDPSGNLRQAGALL